MGKIAAFSQGRAEATAPVSRHRRVSLICSLASEELRRKKGKDRKSSTNAYSRKGRLRKKLYTNVCDKKERKNRPQMPVAKKERPNHKFWWQTKNGCPNQASKQLTPDERNKTAETTSKTQTVAYLQT